MNDHTNDYTAWAGNLYMGPVMNAMKDADTETRFTVIESPPLLSTVGQQAILSMGFRRKSRVKRLRIKTALKWMRVSEWVFHRIVG
jgi:hypothetical protein